VAIQETEASCSQWNVLWNAILCATPLLFNRVSLDAKEVRLGTGLESRSSFPFYPLTPKGWLVLPLGRFSHMNVH